MKLTTAGESHGVALTAIIEGLPSHLSIDENRINDALALRQKGYGRGERQKLEKDTIQILSGVINKKTIGSPISLCIFNQDKKELEPLTKLRPAHADLAGMLKFGDRDVRAVSERASARETAIRVAAGEIFREYISEFGIKVSGRVLEICGIVDTGNYTFEEIEKAKDSPIGMLDKIVEKRAVEKIDELKKDGNTAGGIVEIRINNLKSGFGSPMTYSEKLDSLFAAALMSVQAAKGVEFGAGFNFSSLSGREAYGEIDFRDGKYCRINNLSGGIEGGMSTGDEITIRVVMKPIPTLRDGLYTVDSFTSERVIAAAERADVCAIYAFERICEAAVLEVLANVVQNRLGGDTIEEQKERYKKLY